MASACLGGHGGADAKNLPSGRSPLFSGTGMRFEEQSCGWWFLSSLRAFDLFPLVALRFAALCLPCRLSPRPRAGEGWTVADQPVTIRAGQL